MQTCCLVFKFIFLQFEQHSTSHTPFFLPECKNHAIQRTTLVLALNDAENIPLSENIVIVRVSFTNIPPPPSDDTDSWLIGVGH